MGLEVVVAGVDLEMVLAGVGLEVAVAGVWLEMAVAGVWVAVRFDDGICSRSLSVLSIISSSSELSLSSLLLDVGIVVDVPTLCELN